MKSRIRILIKWTLYPSGDQIFYYKDNFGSGSRSQIISARQDCFTQQPATSQNDGASYSTYGTVPYGTCYDQLASSPAELPAVLRPWWGRWSSCRAHPRHTWPVVRWAGEGGEEAGPRKLGRSGRGPRSTSFRFWLVTGGSVALRNICIRF